MNRRRIAEIAKGNGRADQWLIDEIKTFSMLHQETLRILWELASISEGPILELGPYTGGSTVAMAKGAEPRRTKIITVEKGGSHDHETYPTKDILGDLRANLARFNVSDRISIIEGHNDAPETPAAIRAKLKGQKIGLLFIDSDGYVDRDFKLYQPLLQDGAFVILDDYESDAAPDKTAHVRAFVDRSTKTGFLSDFGVYQWGTWVGAYRGKRSLRSLIGLFRSMVIQPFN